MSTPKKRRSGPGCSKLTTSLVNEMLKFQMLISQKCQYFLLEKCERLFALQKLLSFFQQKNSVYLFIKSQNTERVDLLTSSFS